MARGGGEKGGVIARSSTGSTGRTGHQCEDTMERWCNIAGERSGFSLVVGGCIMSGKRKFLDVVSNKGHFGCKVKLMFNIHHYQAPLEG